MSDGLLGRCDQEVLLLSIAHVQANNSPRQARSAFSTCPALNNVTRAQACSGADARRVTRTRDGGRAGQALPRAQENDELLPLAQ